MIQEPIEILKLHPIRKSRKQKEAFRRDVMAYGEKLGYSVTVEKGSFGARNVILGNPATAKYLISAHYDTPASIGLPNLITPCNLFTYILWQIIMVGIFFLFAFAVGIPVYFLTKSREIGLLAGYIAYFGLLLLLLLGPANKNNANDNTSGVVTVLETARTMPENLRGQVAFLLFDLEEAGLIGSSSYAKAHKEEIKTQIILNLDCCGDGDHIIFFPTKKAKKDEALMKRLHRLGGWFGSKHIQLKSKGFYTYPSDQKNFPVGIGIAAFKKARFAGYYCNKIHTKKDTTLELTNVNLLRTALTTLISEL